MSRNASPSLAMNAVSILEPPAGTTQMVFGRDAGRDGAFAKPAALLDVVAARRRASVAVSASHTPGCAATSSPNSTRESASTRLSRIAVTVAVRVPPVRNAISPTGWPAPISVTGVCVPSRRTEKRPETTTNSASASSPCRMRTSPRRTGRSVNPAKSAVRSVSERPEKRSTSGIAGSGDAQVPLSVSRRSAGGMARTLSLASLL